MNLPKPPPHASTTSSDAAPLPDGVLREVRTQGAAQGYEPVDEATAARVLGTPTVAQAIRQAAAKGETLLNVRAPRETFVVVVKAALPFVAQLHLPNRAARRFAGTNRGLRLVKALQTAPTAPSETAAATA